jgi:phage pi2 protein 07
MISTSKKINKVFLLISFLVLCTPFFVGAQNQLSLSVSPTIFDMTANPGQTWQSTVRVINTNPYDLTIYVEVADFIPKEESGVPQFIPLEEVSETEPSLARWIKTEASVTIPAEKTIELPFSITLPNNAPPGGHFAALMISTKAPEQEGVTPNVQTAQVITSLIFLRVSGDITERSAVRSFRTTDYFLSKPEATFDLRIENKGNVHLQPQGEIAIYNMWGQERGVIPVNQQTLFGNVLPNSVRKYSFTWTGEWSPTDIGRYTAVATLGYGVDEKQFMHADTAFWIIPWKFLLLIIVVVGGFVTLMTWAIKLYVRRMLALAGVKPLVQTSTHEPLPEVIPAPAAVSIPLTKGKRTKKQQLATVVAPIEVGILDLRARFEKTEGIKTSLLVLATFIKQYWKFFVSLASVILFISAIVWFINGASTPDREFEVIIEGEDQTVKVSSENTLSVGVAAPIASTTQNFALSIINRSGDPALTEKVLSLLNKNGYSKTSSLEEDGASEERTVIVYDPKEAPAALRLSKILDNALLSSFTDTSTSTAQITIYLGSETISKVK